ncbi:MAG TPA: hypothetical protein VF721_11885 [Pyrinomonadaceae bacterium]|jgi:hypothetical protein
MATYEECLAALPSFRNDLSQQQILTPFSTTMAESLAAGAASESGEAVAGFTDFTTQGAFAAFATPLNNVHATGVGIRERKGEYDPSEHVIKVFVFDKTETDVIPKTYEGGKIGIDVEVMPIQIVRNPEKPSRQKVPKAKKTKDAGSAAPPPVAPQALPPQRQRIRPIPGGVSISPLNANFVGTLGCFLLRRNIDTEEIFVLSNNHVLADVNRLPLGTLIVQPGPEIPPFLTNPADAFAALHTFIPIQFPGGAGSAPVFNRFDAAIANVTDGSLIQRGQMFGGVHYDPSRVLNPVPGMRVVKMGRTTGFTRGMIMATNLQGTQVNYGTPQFPRIAVFRNTIRIVGDGGAPFSLPGDSGSVILEEETGHPVALLFAGDGVRTTACDLGSLCQQLGAFPI